MELTEKDRRELDAVKAAILANIRCKRLYLFGSYAYGRPRPDSDFDIFAVLADDSQNQIDEMKKFHAAVCDMDLRDVDFIAQTPSAFERRKTYVASIEKTVSQRGVVIYG